MPAYAHVPAGPMSRRNIAQHGNPREHRNILKCLITEFVNVGMPKQALLTSMPARMAPASSFVVALVVHAPCAHKHVNASQAKKSPAALGCYSDLLCARVVILAPWCVMDVMK